MEFSENGTFYVRTYSAGGALPVEGALVRIRGASEENRGFARSYLTDISGVTDVVSLPTPPKYLSEIPNTRDIPYSSYDVEVLKDGFYTKHYYNVAMFSDTEAVLPVLMIPVGDYRADGVYPKGNLDAYITENEYL